MSLASAGRSPAGSKASSRVETQRTGAGLSVASGRSRRKRLLDITLTLGVLTVLAIPMMLIAALIRLTSPGPAIFRQVRLGRDQKPFVLFKFRTMRRGCPEDIHRDFVTRHLAGGDAVESGALHKLASDPRVTPIGRVLRRTSL